MQLKYRKISNIRRTKSPNLKVSRLVLQLSLPNLMKPGVQVENEVSTTRSSSYHKVIITQNNDIKCKCTISFYLQQSSM